MHRIAQQCKLENEETSFITRLDQFNIIFGDQKELCTCDLRKPVRRLFGNTKMRVSAESIVVTEKEVIAAGRGGDLCRFVDS